MQKQAPIDLPEALERIHRAAGQWSWATAATDPIPIGQAAGRILAQPVVADFDHPPFDQSLRDGVVCGPPPADPRDDQSGDAAFQLVGTVLPGTLPDFSLRPGQAARIMTGAALPAGGCTVAMIEEVTWLRQSECGDWTAYPDSDWPTAHSASHVRLPTGSKPPNHVLPRGAIFRKGEVLLPSGTEINPLAIGLLAAANQTQVTCLRPLKAAILVTGDEVIPAGQPLRPGEIYSSNGPLLVASLQQAGLTDIHCHQLRDDVDQQADWLRQQLGNVDLLITTGAVSAGAKDQLPSIFAQLGVQPVLHGVRIKPGKPVFFGVYPSSVTVQARDRAAVSTTCNAADPQDEDSPGDVGDLADPGHPTAVFGLPGNPISVWVTFQLLVRCWLSRLGQVSAKPRWLSARLTRGGDFNDSRLTLWPGRLAWPDAPWEQVAAQDTPDPSLVPDPTLAIDPQVTPLGWLGSADLRAPVAANCLIYFPPNPSAAQPAAALTSGQRVWVFLL